MVDLKVKQRPEVLFLSTALPVQSASAYPCKLKSTLDAYLKHNQLCLVSISIRVLQLSSVYVLVGS
jgi:hypothetical protein